jgi:integrase
MRGDGRVYLRGNIWWMQFSYRGVTYKESAGTADEKTARKKLRKRVAEVSTGKVHPTEERVAFEDLAGALIADYELNSRRSIRGVRLSLSHLQTHFGLDRAINITTDRIRAYARLRQEDGAANGSINRKLAALKRAFNLMVQAGRISQKPYVPMLEEADPRQGFLDPPEFVRIRALLPEYLRDPITFLYLSGWRKSEMQTLSWVNVDIAGGAIRLNPARSKNKETRILPLSGELREIIDRAHNARRLDCSFVFHNFGEPIGDFRKAWRNARNAACLGKVLVHDMRRSAIRNLVRAGVPETVAMALSGHKTRAVFDRYNVTSETDLAAGIARADDLRSLSTAGRAEDDPARLHAEGWLKADLYLNCS